MLIGALVLMLITSWQLTLYVFIAVPLILLPIKALGRQVRFYAKQSQDDVASMGTLIDESLHEIHTLQSYNHEQASVNSFNNSIDKVMASASQRIHYRALLIALIMFISLSSIFVVGWIGAREVIAGNISAGELTAFVFYAVLAGGSIATISEVIGDLQKAVGASERIVELLNTAPEITNSPTAKDKNHLNKHPLFDESAAIIEANEITFSYPSASDKAVIKNISFNAQRGEKIAIVGHSGAGKSTLFDLLMRFYELNQGDIKIAGIPQKALSIEGLRKQFALVPQDAVIFALSVSDNIRLSKPDATDDEIVAAAKLAYADEFIQGFSQGYQTELGERGVKLSGGQKQRIAIARAILAKRPILLLDEATSALDASSERYVKLALDSLMQETTTLIIAHRLSTVLNADKILVMQQGELIAQGTHDTLLMSNTVYKEFVELQLS
jgi:ATP-binding cassette subfamily B protein